MTKGIFISIEGGEGVGKTLFTQGLESKLIDHGLEVTLTREPGGTPVGGQIRSLFMKPPKDDPLLPGTELLLVAAARHQHVEKLIRPKIEQGHWVICDRFSDSTEVYQGILGGVDPKHLKACYEIGVGQTAPSITFLLDCDVAVAMKRLGQRDSCAEAGNRYDAAGAEFHEKLRQGYLAVAERNKDRIVILDASQAPEKVLADALLVINEKLGIKL